jgi:lantibiotic transport system permease protein
MKTVVHVLQAENLKLRRTLALWLAVIAPLSVTLLQFGIFSQNGPGYLRADVAPWMWICQSNLVLWSLIMLPLFVTLEIALLANMEHANRTWKKLFALPVPRWMTIAAKQFTALKLIALSMVMLWAFTLLMGFALQAVDPGFGLTGAPPWASLLGYSALVFLASWLMIAINTWVALRWQNFVVASAFGIIATVAGMVVIHSDLLGPFYPWAIPGMVGNLYNEGRILWREILVGCAGGVGVFLLSNLALSRRQVK